MKRSFVLFSGLLLMGTISCAQSGPGLRPGYQPQNPTLSKIIIQFKGDFDTEELSGEKLSPKDMMPGSSYLEKLNAKYKLHAVERLFTDPRPIDEIIQKFPERAKRMPKGGAIPVLNPTYVLEFSAEDLDLKEVCEAYAKSPLVEFAQPDYSVTTYSR